MNRRNSDTEGGFKAKLGSVGKCQDGRKFVRFERRLPSTMADLWRALSDPEALSLWFPGLALERWVGGKFAIWFDEQRDGPPHVVGTVTRYLPPKMLEYGTMRFELEADGHRSRLIFTDILQYQGPLSEPEVINSVLGGWHKYLDRLEFALVGGGTDPRDADEFDYASVEIVGRDERPK